MLIIFFSKNPLRTKSGTGRLGSDPSRRLGRRRLGSPPTTESHSRVRLHARKPAAWSPAAGADADTSSRLENVVLKAAWYGSELIGIAASLLRPSPPPSEGDAGGDAEGGAAGALDHAGVVEAIKEDFARSYFVTGNLTLRAYEEDCEFAGSFRGLRRFIWNCTNFGSVLEKSNMKLTKWEDLEAHQVNTNNHRPSRRIVAQVTRWIPPF